VASFSVYGEPRFSPCRETGIGGIAAFDRSVSEQFKYFFIALRELMELH